MRMNEGQMGTGLVGGWGGVGIVVGGCLLERPQLSTLLLTQKHHENMQHLGKVDLDSPASSVSFLLLGRNTYVQWETWWSGVSWLRG